MTRHNKLHRPSLRPVIVEGVRYGFLHAHNTRRFVTRGGCQKQRYCLFRLPSWNHVGAKRDAVDRLGVDPDRHHELVRVIEEGDGARRVANGEPVAVVGEGDT